MPDILESCGGKIHVPSEGDAHGLCQGMEQGLDGQGLQSGLLIQVALLAARYGRRQIDGQLK